MDKQRDFSLKIKKRLGSKENVNPILRGVITDSTGNQSGTNTIWADQNTKRVWWMMHGATQPSQIRCQRIPSPYIGLKVIAGYAPGNPELEILSDDPLDRMGNTTGSNWTTLDTPDLLPGGRAMLWLQPKAVEPLATWPGSGVSVNINPGYYQYAKTWVYYAGISNYNLLPYQPAGPNEHRLVGLYLDSAGALHALAGATVGTGVTPPAPAWPVEILRLSTVLITDTTASFSFATDITDWRGLWNDPIGGGWPYDHVFTVDPTNPSADFSTIQAAHDDAGVVDGDCLLIGEGAYNETVVMTKDLTLIGLGQVTITSSTAEATLTINSASLGVIYLQNIQVYNTYDSSAVDDSLALKVVAAGICFIQNCVFDAGGGGAGNANVCYGAKIDAGYNYFDNCSSYGYDGATYSYGLYVSAAAFVFPTLGIYDGDTNDVFSAGNVFLARCELSNNSVAGAGGIYGEYVDGDKVTHYVGKTSPVNGDIPAWSTTRWLPQSLATLGALLVDQTTPQTIINGLPLLDSGRVFTDPHQIVDKAYVDLAVASLKLDEYFSSTSSSYGGIYYLMAPTPAAAGTVVSATISSATTTNVFNFATASGEPHLDRLLAGNYDIHAHLLKTGTRSITCYCELYQRNLADVETLLGTSSSTPALTDGDLFYDLYINLPTEVTLLTTDRLVLKWYAVSGVGGNTTVTMTVGGTSDPHISINVAGAELDQLLVPNLNVCEGRLTLTTGTPVTTADVTAATVVYFTPFKGSRIRLYDGATYWPIYTFTEKSIKLTDTQSGATHNGTKIIDGLTDTSQLIPGMEITGTNVGAGSVIDTVDSTTQVTGTVNSTGSATNNITFKIPASKLVDVFAVPVAGAVSLRFGPLWTNITTRATALTTQNGVDVLTGSTTWRWLGTVGTTTTAGQTEDSISKRFVWNYYNTVLRYCRSYNTNTSWNLVGATAAREFNAGTGQVRAEIVLGKARLVHSLFNCYFSACQDGFAWNGGIGFDATNAYALGGLSRGVGNAASTAPIDIGPAFNITLAAEGYHYITQLEGSGGTATNYPGGGTYSQLQVFLEN